MNEEQDSSVLAVADTDEAAASAVEAEPEAVEREPMPPVESRFMFVDIAALRAKQLRRGALARVTTGTESEGDAAPRRKLERIAMQEIEEGLVVYQLPDEKGDKTDGDAASQSA